MNNINFYYENKQDPAGKTLITDNDVYDVFDELTLSGVYRKVIVEFTNCIRFNLCNK